MRDARVLALIGPTCNWRRLQYHDAYECRHCHSRVTGLLIHDLKRSLGRR